MLAKKISTEQIPPLVYSKLMMKLMISESLAREYVEEYKRFLIMAACS